VTTEFLTANRVLVSLDSYWAKGAAETVSEPHAEVKVLGGTKDNDMTRQELSARDEATFFWVWFDEPQLAASRDGPYRGGCILEGALTLISRSSD
jgi:hypothetical protein